MTDKPKNLPSRTVLDKGAGKLPVLEQKARRLIEGIVNGGRAGEEKIPNASLIYGMASAALVSISLYYLFTGGWFNGVMVFILGAAMFGYALHFMNNPD